MAKWVKRIGASILAALALTSAVSGQTTLTIPSAAGSSNTSSIGAPPEAYDSPQATVQTFLQDMKQSRSSEARKAMDLADIPFPVRDTRGDLYAGMLASVLARLRNFQPDALPSSVTGLSFEIPVKKHNGEKIGVLTLDKAPSGIWHFGPGTVSSLPHLFRAMQEEPQDNGLGPFPDPPPDPSMQVRAVMPAVLLLPFIWFEIWQWLGLLALALASFLLARFMRLVVKIFLRIFFRRIDDRLADFTQWSLRRSVGLLAGASLWWFLYEYLGLEGRPLLILVVFLKLFVSAGSAWVADAVIDLFIDTFQPRASALVRRADSILIPIAKKFIRFVLVVIALLAFAASMSVNIAGLVAGLGIGGLVLALAGKDSVENIFGSLTIIFDMPFGIGDYIKMSGAEGTIEEINLRSTRIRTSNDTLITLPNANLIKAAVENYGARRARRFNVTLPLNYANDPKHVEKFCEEARKAVLKIDKVRQEDAHIELTKLDAANLGLTVEIFYETSDYAEELQLREKTIGALLKAASSAKVILGATSLEPTLNPQPATSSPDKKP
jgi:MscS family membrane protein